MSAPTQKSRLYIWLYALPNLPLAFPTLPVFVMLPTFYAQDMGLGLGVTGLVLALTRLTDVVTDPVIGFLSDRVPTPWGRRKPWMALGGIMAGVAFYHLVLPPESAGIWHLALWSIVLYLGWTMVAVPYAAWGAELSNDYMERTRITSVREAAMLVGVVLAGAAPFMVEAFALDIDPIVLLCAMTLLIGGPTLLCVIALVPRTFIAETSFKQAPATTTLSIAALKELWRNAVFKRLVAAWFINGVAVGLPAALFPLFLEHVLGVSDTQQGLLIFLYFAFGILSLPLWLWLSARHGKHRVWVWAMALASMAFLAVPTLSMGDWVAFAIICMMTGAALGADLALPPAMQADVVDYHAWRTGEKRAGLAFAIWSMMTKAALALSIGLGFQVLEMSPFDSSLPVGDPNQVLWPLVALYALLPVALKLIAMWLVWSYPLTPHRYAAIQNRLQRRSPPAHPVPSGLTHGVLQ